MCKAKLYLLVPVIVVFIGIYFCRDNFYHFVQYCMGGNSSHTMAAPFVINATAKHTATVIFLHGLGDTGQGWCQAFKMIQQPHIKYVCPTANTIPVTLNGGFAMPSWFDIKGLGPGSAEDEAGIKSASQILQNLISKEEECGVARNRIVIGGFSQGGAVALYSALAEPKPNVGGILALSTWLPLHKTFLTSMSQAIKSNKETHILQCHGDADPMVNVQFGQQTELLLKSFNKNHEFKTYKGMGHSSCEQEMQDMKKFIDERLPPV